MLLDKHYKVLHLLFLILMVCLPSSTTTMSTPQPIFISSARITQVTRTIYAFLDLFEKPAASLTPADFQTVFSDSIEWYDHGFMVRRVGVPAVRGLQRDFLYVNQPFHAEIKVHLHPFHRHFLSATPIADVPKSIIPTVEGAVLEQVWHGKLIHDVVQPDGQLSMKATNKTFATTVGMVLKIDEDGKILRIDEYDRKWEDGIPESEYVVMEGGKKKAKM
jgi:hypothetical protein